MVTASPSQSAVELLDGVLGDWCEEVDKVPVGVAEQDGAVAPRHGGGLLHPVADQGLEPLILAVDVINAELDDDGVVVGGASGVFPEQLCRLRCGLNATLP